MKNRTEHDSLGKLDLPEELPWGIHTARALNNFAFTGPKVPQELLAAIVTVKKAAALANIELEKLDRKKGEAILQACDMILSSDYTDAFPLPALQGGAGTSTNMNVNEVIANLAIESLGGKRGDYSLIHPLDHVNLHQSTNDVYPSALKIAAIEKVRALSEIFADLQTQFQLKEQEFANIVKIGRTEMQSAVPLTLGAEFGAFAEAFARDRWRTFKCEERLRTLNIGGTAVGTGLTAPRSYIFLVIEKLRELTGLGLCRGENCVDQTANADAFVEVSAIMKSAATNFMKVTDDLRMLHFLEEIALPPVQAGSSIMPGKINPVICEAVIQGAMKAISCDSLVGQCAARGTLQINEFLPLLADSLLESFNLIGTIAEMLSAHVAKIEANEAVCRERFEHSPVIITAFLPYIGYEKSGKLVEEFKQSGKVNVKDFLTEKLGMDLVERTLSPQNLVALGYRD